MESDTIQPKRLANTISGSPKGTLILLVFNYFVMYISAVFKSTKKADILYFCKVYYEIKAVLQWQVILTVVRRLNALLQVMLSCVNTLNILCSNFSTWNQNIPVLKKVRH